MGRYFIPPPVLSSFRPPTIELAVKSEVRPVLLVSERLIPEVRYSSLRAPVFWMINFIIPEAEAVRMSFVPVSLKTARVLPVLVPETSSFAPGPVVPIPTFPELKLDILVPDWLQ